MNKNQKYINVELTSILERKTSELLNCQFSSILTGFIIQSRTFACSYEGRPSGLVLDIKQGISLYDIPTKVSCLRAWSSCFLVLAGPFQSYVWHYRFRDLHSSSDDGKVHVQFVFKDERSLNPGKLETKVPLRSLIASHRFFSSL